MKSILVAAAGVVFAVSSASAETKSWAVMKTNVPTNSEVLVGADLKAMRSAASFAKVIENFPEVGPALSIVKSTCSIDAATSVSDVTVSIKTKGPDEIIVAVGLDGVDEAKLVACATKLAQLSSAKSKVTSKASGKVTEYTIDDGTTKKTMYAAWPKKDVVVFSADPEDKAKLDPYFNGKAVQGDMATFFNKLSTGSAVAWVSAVIGEDHIKGAYGTATFAKGTFTGAMRVVADSAKDAGDQSKEATKALAEAIKQAPADVAKVLKSVKVGVSGSEITIDGTLADADAAAFLPALFKM